MYIATGSFIIRGKRNFVQPRTLTLGLTVMFALGEDSMAKHLGERKSRLEQEDIEKLEQEKQEQSASEQQSEVEEVSIVQVGQVRKKKN